MSLRSIAILYAVCTVGALATPGLVYLRETAIRRAMPVNSEPSLESAPELHRILTDASAEAVPPMCVAPDGTAFFVDDRGLYVGGVTSARRAAIGPGHIRWCALFGEESAYLLMPWGNSAWLRSYDPQRHLNWEVATDDELSPPAIGRDGSLYFFSTSRVWQKDGRGFLSSSRLDAYDRNGNKLWSVPFDGSFPTIGPDGTIYAVTDRALVAISPRGTERWRALLPQTFNRGYAGIIVGEHGTIFVKLPQGVAAFGPNGGQLWEFSTGTGGSSGHFVLGEDGTLYLASRFLFALDQTGRLRWTFKSELTYLKDDSFDSLVVGKDGVVYALSSYQLLYAITPDGRKKWQLAGTPQESWNRLVLTRDGKLITRRGWLQASAGIGSRGWPAPNHDFENTRRQEWP